MKLKKRVAAWALCLLMMLSCAQGALAEPKLSGKLFTRAKEAVSLISYGEYAKALKKLAFSENVPSADELEEFICEQLPEVFSAEIQQEVGVGYYAGGCWTVAIPVKEPADDAVMAFLLTSADGKSFDGYGVMDWGSVMEAAGASDAVVWKEAYEPTQPVIVAD